MSDLFNIGVNGVRAYQSALSTTSENIANAATPGYSRRTAVLSEFGAATPTQFGHNIKLSGNGSIVAGIARTADVYKAAEVRTSGADLARTESGIVWLDRLEGALTGNQLGERLTAFFNSAQGVAADPAASAPRAVMIENATSLAAAFGGTGRALDNARADLSGSGTDAARSLSDLSQSLARTNIALGHVDANSNGQAQLFDERDRILESMSALTDISVTTDQFGRASVRVGGGSGPVLTNLSTANYVTFKMNDDGAVAFTLHDESGPHAVSAQGGVFAGINDSAAKIAGTRASLNELATRFVTTVNTVQGAGRDLDGVAGPAMFAVGASPTDVSVVLTDPRKIAAAAVGEGVRGNGNITTLATLRTSGGFEAGLDDLTTSNAAALSARRNVASAQGAIHDSAVAARDAVSGVDLDEEAVNLIRFQQAYQASSRVIQVARDILQTIININ